MNGSDLPSELHREPRCPPSPGQCLADQFFRGAGDCFGLVGLRFSIAAVQDERRHRFPDARRAKVHFADKFHGAAASNRCGSTRLVSKFRSQVRLACLGFAFSLQGEAVEAVREVIQITRSIPKGATIIA